MKLANHKITMTALMCVSILFLSNPSMATDVGGIINADTTWDLAGSPYNITSAIQIDEGITLTIEPGVVVNSTGYPLGIEVWGALTAIGNENNTIILNDVPIIPGDTATQAEINIQFAEINITQSDVRLAARGSLILKDSKIMDYSSGGDSFDIDSRSADSYIERNIFYRVHGLFINPEGKVVHVRNNVFYGNSYGLKPVGSSGHFIIQHNSFLHFIDHAIELEPDTFFPILAMINYWNTTDTNVIDSLIWDASDDFNIFFYVEYIPFLTEPHPDTPIFPIPNAEFSADLTSGFQPLTVDFTDKSIGEIDSWEWNFGDGSPTSFEQNPTHIYDQPGIYSVSLTVNDSSGFDTEVKTDYITVNKAEPTPDIKLNGSDGPLYVSTSESVAVTISLDPGIYTGTPADWWIGVISSYGTIPFLGQSIPIFELPETTLLDIPLPTGVWIFYFILDDIPNGQLDNVTWFDYGVVVSLPE